MPEKKEGLGQEGEAGKKEEEKRGEEEEVSTHEGSSSPIHGFTTPFTTPPPKIDDNVVRAKMFEDFGIAQVSFISFICQAFH